MKKGESYEGIVESIQFPNKGIVVCDGEKVVVKNALPGQKVRFTVNKKRKGKVEGRLEEVLVPGAKERPSPCPHYGACGGCLYLPFSYEDQLAIKEEQIKNLLEPVLNASCEFEGILGSPKPFGYRNKMEFSFGDAYKDGPLALGMHKRNSFYDIVSVTECQIADEDYRRILNYTLEYFEETKLPFYHRVRKEGYLRHLLVRKGHKTGEILVDLITTGERMVSRPAADAAEEKAALLTVDGKTVSEILKEYAAGLLALPLTGSIIGILHTINNREADVVQNDGTEILYGTDRFEEVLLGLTFEITPFSFFQTNSYGAEVLYEKVREYVGDTKGKVVFDLYSGTGTIAQILAPVAEKVVGVEIVEEAVEAARRNAQRNGLTNCTFLAGDVLKVLDDLTETPDILVLDPPRDGIHPKALPKLIAYGVERIVYISCKPTSLARDLEVFQGSGYVAEKVCCVDMFPGTGHVECVVLISREE